MERGCVMKKGTGYLIFNAIFIVPSIIMIGFNGVTALPIILMIFSLSITGFMLMSNKVSDEQEKFYSSLENNISKIDNFNADKIHRAVDSVIALDEKSEKVAVSDKNGTYVYNFRDIVESEIIQDEVSISKVSRAGQLGGALVGGALAGGVGAVIGGLSSVKTNETQVKNITLKLVVDSLQNPYQTVRFLNSQVPLKANNPEYTKAFDAATHWQSVLSVILKRNNKE